MIFESDRHESITSSSWDDKVVRETIEDIFNQTINSLSDNLWPPHPSEDSKAEVNKSFYFGATGTLWGLLYLSQKLNRQLSLDPVIIIKKIRREYLLEQDTGSQAPSYFLGQLGIDLLDYKLNPSPELANEIYELVENNIENPCVDALWGCPGTMLPALFLYESLGEVRWKELFIKNANYLIEVWKQHEQTRLWYWEYKSGENIIPFIGAGHGYWGNVFPLLKGFNLLTETQQELILKRTLDLTLKLAKRKDSMANWPATLFGKGDDTFRLQWCHGAPGMIQALELFPKDYDQQLEELFVAAGEAIWQAGPLKKGIGICHGTDGNGISLLKLYKRTGDKEWLKRAQKFAMHALETRNARHTLWTGEIGLACFLQGCLEEEGFFPGLDFF